MVMNTRISLASALAMAAALLSAPLALAAAPSHADAFIKKAVQGNLAEIKMGQLAERKGATAAVRHLGAVLVQDHSEANQKAMAAASSMGVTPPAEPNSKEVRMYRHLAGLSGRRFDQAFVKAQVKDHEKDIAKYRKEAKAPTGPAATYASMSLPVLHKHLRMAEALEHHSPRG
jgi:putative membrane protein